MTPLSVTPEARDSDVTVISVTQGFPCLQRSLCPWCPVPAETEAPKIRRLLCNGITLAPQLPLAVALQVSSPAARAASPGTGPGATPGVPLLVAVVEGGSPLMFTMLSCLVLDALPYSDGAVTALQLLEITVVYRHHACWLPTRTLSSCKDSWKLRGRLLLCRGLLRERQANSLPSSLCSALQVQRPAALQRGTG